MLDETNVRPRLMSTDEVTKFESKETVLAAMKHRLPVYVWVNTGALNETSSTTSDVMTKSRTLA